MPAPSAEGVERLKNRFLARYPRHAGSATTAPRWVSGFSRSDTTPNHYTPVSK